MDVSITQSIKSRIALLNLDQVGRNRSQSKPHRLTTPTAPQQNNASTGYSNGNVLRNTTNNTSNPFEFLRINSASAARNGEDLRQAFKNLIQPIAPIFTSSKSNKPNPNVIIPPKPKEFNVQREQSQPDVPQNPNTNCYACIDYSTADDHAARFPRHNVTSIDKLAHDLTLPFSTSPVLKARAIFTLFHHNIAYDTAAFFSGNIRHKTPEETLRSGLAVCQGYAELFERLARSAGLEVILITGHGKGFSYSPIKNGTIPPFASNHAWNAVKLNGKWQPMDPCWGAGSLENSRHYVKHLKPDLFTSTPEQFRFRHFPTKPEHQLLPQSISWSEYISMKEHPLICKRFADVGLSEYSLEPNVREIPVSGQSVYFVVRNKCPHTRIPPQDRVVLVLSFGESRITMQMEDEGKLWTAVVDSALLKRSGNVQLNFIDRLGNRSGKGLTPQEFERQKTREGYSSTGLAQWTVR